MRQVVPIGKREPATKMTIGMGKLTCVIEEKSIVHHSVGQTTIIRIVLTIVDET